ncbi:hypothetical protein [Streptomyces sp. MBT98]|nr:hypothetical protein [Streptomyces sp. MBT98]
MSIRTLSMYGRATSGGNAASTIWIVSREAARRSIRPLWRAR